MSTPEIRRARPEEIDTVRAVQRAALRGAAALRWSTDRHALGFYQRMGGCVIGSEPSGMDGDDPLTLTELRVDGTWSHGRLGSSA